LLLAFICLLLLFRRAQAWGFFRHWLNWLAGTNASRQYGLYRPISSNLTANATRPDSRRTVVPR
jgi:hypothetical protein